jgi:hypothetical protein
MPHHKMSYGVVLPTVLHNYKIDWDQSVAVLLLTDG